MTGPKAPKSYQEQVDILKQRGCIINSDAACIETLASINYYRLSAYFLPFKQENGLYRKGTTFEQVFQIYEFDRRLRTILFAAVEVIEISLRTRLAYLHGNKYGPLGYRDPRNFNRRHNACKFYEMLATEINRNKKLPFVQHHQTKYHEDFPIWVIVELFSFGMLSYYYSDLLAADQRSIADQYQVNYRHLASWLRCLTDLRNICAHYGRLYYRVFSASPAGLNLAEGVKRRLWGIVLVLKAVYPLKEEWNRTIVPSLEELFAAYGQYIDIYHLAFPRNWLSQLKK